MIKVIKKGKYYFFFKSNKFIKTNGNNKIKVADDKAAKQLSKYMSACFKSKNKEKSFFLRVLFFSFDLDKSSKSDIIDKILFFLSTDLLCYRAVKNSELESFQKKLWDPLISFVEEKYKLTFNITNGVIPVKHKATNKVRLGKILKKLNKQELTSYYYITNISNSNIIALNFLANNINFKHAWKCLSLEEDYNLKKWGQDKEAKEKLLEKKSYFNEIINLYLLFKKSEK